MKGKHYAPSEHLSPYASRTFLRKLTGFIKDTAYESTDEQGNLHYLSIAVCLCADFAPLRLRGFRIFHRRAAEAQSRRGDQKNYLANFFITFGARTRLI